MKPQDAKPTNRLRSNLCSVSGLLLSVVCCVALIHVELRIQEHHRLIANSVTSCDQLESKILQKVQQNYREWQLEKCGHVQSHRGETKGMLIFPWVLKMLKVFLSAVQQYSARSWPNKDCWNIIILLYVPRALKRITWEISPIKRALVILCSSRPHHLVLLVLQALLIALIRLIVFN